jgi:hypothetical protein
MPSATERVGHDPEAQETPAHGQTATSVDYIDAECVAAAPQEETGKKTKRYWIMGITSFLILLGAGIIGGTMFQETEEKSSSDSYPEYNFAEHLQQIQTDCYVLFRGFYFFSQA